MQHHISPRESSPSSSSFLQRLLLLLALLLPVGSSCSGLGMPTSTCLVTFYTTSNNETLQDGQAPKACSAVPLTSNMYPPPPRTEGDTVTMDIDYDPCDFYSSNYGNFSQGDFFYCCISMDKFERLINYKTLPENLAELDASTTHVRLDCAANDFVPPSCGYHYIIEILVLSIASFLVCCCCCCCIVRRVRQRAMSHPPHHFARHPDVENGNELATVCSEDNQDREQVKDIDDYNWWEN